MNVVSTHKGQTIVAVVVEKADAATEQELAAFAAKKAGQTLDSLFGWTVSYSLDDDRWTVCLFTD